MMPWQQQRLETDTSRAPCSKFSPYIYIYIQATNIYLQNKLCDVPIHACQTKQQTWMDTNRNDEQKGKGEMTNENTSINFFYI